MKSLQKQLCGIAVLIFGLIVAVIGLGVGNVLSLIGGVIGLWGLGMTFWNQEETTEEDTTEDENKQIPQKRSVLQVGKLFACRKGTLLLQKRRIFFDIPVPA